MKTPKLLFAIAIVFAALSFSVKASAQTDATVVLNYSDTRSSLGANPYVPEEYVTWEVTLHDVSTNEDYVFDTDGWSHYETSYYVLGVVPAGASYTTTVQYSCGLISTMYAYWDIVADDGSKEMAGNMNVGEGYNQLLTDWNHTDNALYVNDIIGIVINRD